MTAEQIRKAIVAQPFQPFTVKMADGQTFHVRHPDFVARSENGRTFAVYDDDGFSILDTLLASELRFTNPPVAEQEESAAAA